LDLLIVGAATGLLFGSFFITFTCLLIFFMYKDNHPVVKKMLESSTPTKFVMSVLLFSNFSFAVLGIIFTYIYIFLQNIFTLEEYLITNLFYIIFVIILAIPMTVFTIRFVKSHYFMIFICLGIYIALFGILIPLLIN